MDERIDLQRETPITLRDVARYVPTRRGRKIHYSTVFRWVTRGARGRVLASVLVGGVRFTTVEALQRFLNSSSSESVQHAVETDLVSIEAALDEAGL